MQKEKYLCVSALCASMARGLLFVRSSILSFLFLVSLLSSQLFLFPSNVSAETIGTMEIVGTQTWDAPSYEINGKVHINVGSVLNISPDSNVTVLSGGKFNVNGTLNIPSGTNVSTDFSYPFSSTTVGTAIKRYIKVQTSDVNKKDPVINITKGYVNIEGRQVESDRPFMNVLSSSTIFISNSLIRCDNPNAVFINIFNNSQIGVANSYFDKPKCKNMINAFDGTYVLIASSTGNNFQGEAFVKAFGTAIQPKTSVEIKSSKFIGLPSNASSTSEFLTIPVQSNRLAYIFANAEFLMKDSMATGFSKAIELSSNAGAKIDFSEFDQNETPLTVWNTNLSVTNSALTNSLLLAIDSRSSTSTAVGNWWGTPNGPIKISDWQGVDLIPQKVSDEVQFTPWLRENPKKPAPTCCSSVFFIPGAKGSRLYRVGGSGEHQLWVPLGDSDVKSLAMNSTGQTVDSTIYTKDIVDKAAKFMGWESDLKPYADFMARLEDWKIKGDIKDYFNFAYDWRLRPQEIVEKGTLYPNNIMTNPVAEILLMAKTSKTGKVTIITHSNGGLVAKSIMQKLIDLGRPDVIDKVVTVAMPEFGAPQAVATLLHGDGEAIGGGFVLSQSVAREFAENVSSAYNFLPSSSYFSSVSTANSSSSGSLIQNTSAGKVVMFKGVSDVIKQWIKKFGESISSSTALKNFLLADKSMYFSSKESNLLDIPALLNNALISYAGDSHSIWDGFTFPINIPWYSIQAIGKTTLAGLKYIDNLKCKASAGSCSQIPGREGILTSNGDGTVVFTNHSNDSTIPNLTKINLELDKSNKQNGTNISHADLMRDNSLESTVDQIVHNKFDSAHPPQFIKIATNAVRNNIYHKLSVFSPATIKVTDSEGRTTGIFRDPVLGTNIKQDIPNSSYIDVGEAKSVIVPDSDLYSIKIEGYDVGTFSFEDKLMIDSDESGIMNDSLGIIFRDIPVTDSVVAGYQIVPGQLQNLINQNVDSSSTLAGLESLSDLRIDIDGDNISDTVAVPILQNANGVEVGSSGGSSVLDDPVKIKSAILDLILRIKKAIQESSALESIKKGDLEKAENLEKTIYDQKNKDKWYEDKGLSKLIKEVSNKYEFYLKKENKVDENKSMTGADSLSLKNLYSALYFYYTRIDQILEPLLSSAT